MGSQLAQPGPATPPPPSLLPTPSAFPARSGLDCGGTSVYPCLLPSAAGSGLGIAQLGHGNSILVLSGGQGDL